jgi:hypothetical protein
MGGGASDHRRERGESEQRREQASLSHLSSPSLTCTWQKENAAYSAGDTHASSTFFDEN